MHVLRILVSGASLALWGACSQPPSVQVDYSNWKAVMDTARGQTLTMAMWQGDPQVNSYMQSYVVPTLRDSFGIALQLASGQGAELLQLVLAEKSAGVEASAYDLLWINGETFYQLRQIDALFGPFTQYLPNEQYLRWSDSTIAFDFQQPVQGYEAPWGNVQFVLIYDSSRVQHPPRDLVDLRQWVQAHPGKFTWPTDFSGMTLLKMWMMSFADSATAFSGSYREAAYEKYSSMLWKYVRELKPYLWNQGQTFPASVAQLHRMYASGEVAFTMSNNDGDVDAKVQQGLFPATSKAMVPEYGSIRNTHYIGILKASDHKAAALVVANFLLSPAAQLRKLRTEVWGDGTVLQVEALPPVWQPRFEAALQREHAPQRNALRERSLQEPAPEYMIRLFEDFRKEIIEK